MSFSPLKPGCKSCEVRASAELDLVEWGQTNSQRCQSCIRTADDEAERRRMQLIHQRNREALESLMRRSGGKLPLIKDISSQGKS